MKNKSWLHTRKNEYYYINEKQISQVIKPIIKQSKQFKQINCDHCIICVCTLTSMSTINKKNIPI